MKVLFFIGFFCYLINAVLSSLPCILRDYSYGSVCVCNATYCDTLDELDLKGPNEFILVSSSKGGLRFSITNGTFNSQKTYQVNDFKNAKNNEEFWQLDKFIYWKFNDENSAKIQIKINRKVTYQKMMGFGGAFTGAVAYNLNLLPDVLRYQIYKSYFSKDSGISYNFLRIPIGGCDFDTEPWAYNEYPINDVNLSNFTKLDYRDELKINFINELKQVTNNHDIRFFGAAWSPPKWMKTNNEWTGHSSLKNEYYQTWANYFIRYFKLMAAKNISFWGLSTGNEPTDGSFMGSLFINFMSLGWTPEKQGIWVKENLGPTLKESEFKNVKIISNEDQRYSFPAWFKGMDKGAINSTDYLDGLGIHWYWDFLFPSSVLDTTHRMYPDKFILNTESCVGSGVLDYHGPQLGDWKRAEKYIKSYIDDFKHWINGWIDWNLLLNEQGGPNYVENYVDAPIIINTTSKNEFYKQPMFYGIGHFSKFIHENSIRIESETSDNDIKIVSFQRPDEKIVTILYNSKRTPVKIEIFDNNHSDEINIEIPGKSVHTIIYK